MQAWDCQYVAATQLSLSQTSNMTGKAAKIIDHAAVHLVRGFMDIWVCG